MLSDPLSITYDGVGKSLPRAVFDRPGVSKQLERQTYLTSDGQFAVETASYAVGKHDVRVEIILYRIIPDTDSDPFNGVNAEQFGNGFGLVLVLNKFRYQSTVDLPKLRTAISSFVDSTILNRLIGGEL